MDDLTALRRTIRRCTAVLVVAVGVAIAALAGSTAAPVGLGLAITALLYLAGSLVSVPDSASTATPDDGDSER
ncbi:hypothetical protein ACFQL1_07735 [Halomicroarcula sp. GCM10025709]|uniref:hypothetical protein n=1 Tax=Haloarcula TaxID=2237 RepID=UPI0024C38E91|nr:hypothetical protein [Halomicroarcula sp. YJ-61-S]